MKYYTFKEQCDFEFISKRYDVPLNKLLTIIKRYVDTRNDIVLQEELFRVVGDYEPFIKNELKPTIQLLCQCYDSMDYPKLTIDSDNRIKIYEQHEPSLL